MTKPRWTAKERIEQYKDEIRQLQRKIKAIEKAYATYPKAEREVLIRHETQPIEENIKDLRRRIRKARFAKIAKLLPIASVVLILAAITFTQPQFLGQVTGIEKTEVLNIETEQNLTINLTLGKTPASIRFTGDIRGKGAEIYVTTGKQTYTGIDSKDIKGRRGIKKFITACAETCSIENGTRNITLRIIPEEATVRLRSITYSQIGKKKKEPEENITANITLNKTEETTSINKTITANETENITEIISKEVNATENKTEEKGKRPEEEARVEKETEKAPEKKKETKETAGKPEEKEEIKKKEKPEKENKPPTVTKVPQIEIEQNSAATIELGKYITDPEGDNITISATGNEDVKITASGTILKIETSETAKGEYKTEITASDGKNKIKVPLYIKVRGNKEPALKKKLPMLMMEENMAATLNLDSYFYDPEGEKLTYQAEATNGYKTRLKGAVLVIESPENATNGSITITASDGKAETKGKIRIKPFNPEEEEQEITIVKPKRKETIREGLTQIVCRSKLKDTIALYGNFSGKWEEISRRKVPAGKTATFYANLKAGRYEFQCISKNGKAKSEKQELEVERKERKAVEIIKDALTKETVTGKGRRKIELNSRPAFMKDKTGKYRPFREVVKVKERNGKVRAEWNGKTTEIEPVVVYNGTEYNASRFAQLDANILYQPVIQAGESYKFGFRFENIPQSIADKIEKVILAINIPKEDIQKAKTGTATITLPDNIEISFKDLERAGYSINITNATRVEVGNVKGKTTLDLDPTISLGGTSSTRIKADIYAYEGSLLTKDWEFQIKWNITGLPSDATITNAQFCVYWETAGGTDNDANISRVNDQTWDETIGISAYNNQALTNKTTGTWNSTAASTYGCLNVTKQVQEDVGNTYTSFRISDPDYPLDSVTGVTDSETNSVGLAFGHTTNPYNQGEDRENSRGTGNYPKLTIEYTSATDLAPTVELRQPSNNKESPKLTVSFQCEATDDYDIDNVTLYGNFTGTWKANATKTASGNSDTDYLANFTLTLDNGTYIWNCKAYDNNSKGNWSSANYTLTVKQNVPPEVNEAVLMPQPAMENDDLMGYCNATDPEGKNVSYYWKWYKNGKENLTGQEVNPFYCYQESANASTGCGGLSTGDYNCIGSFATNYKCSNATDGSWTTASKPESGTTAYVYMNYTIPENATGQSLWQVKVGIGTTPVLANYSIPTSCWRNPLELRVKMDDSTLSNSKGECWNGSEWKNIFMLNKLALKEEAIYWYMKNGTEHDSGKRVPVSKLNASNTTAGENWTFSCMATDLVTNSSWKNSTIATIGSPNVMPDTPTASINSTDGTNVSTQDLNCNAQITDPNGDDLNATVRWYKNNALNLTAEYNNSYANGTNFSATLSSALTRPGENWSCSVQTNDGKAASYWGNSKNITVKLTGQPATYTTFQIPPSTDFNRENDITNVCGATLKYDGGMIKWNKCVNAAGANFDLNVRVRSSFAYVNAKNLHKSFNTSANITLYNLSYEFTPTILMDGQPCPASVCTVLSYEGGNLTFNVSHFTNYSVTANTNLTIWDETDLEGGSKTAAAGEQVKFYANYTKRSTGEMIRSARMVLNTTDLDPGDATYSLALFDYDGDGIRDEIAVGTTGNELIAIWLNGSQIWQNTDGYRNYDVRAYDITQDGKDEIVVADSRGTYVHYRNGTTYWDSDPSDSEEDTALAIGDTDQDGKPEIATFENNEYHVMVLEDNGTGKWNVSTPQVAHYEIIISDFDRDGYDDDIAVVEYNTLTVLRNDGQVLMNITSYGRPRTLEAADLDHDGYKDELIVGERYGKVEVYRWNGTMAAEYTSSDAIMSDNTATDYIYESSRGDLDNDGQEDEFVVGSDDGKVIAYDNNTQVLWSYTLPSSTDVNSMLVDDIDGDGQDDIIVGTANEARGLIYVFNRTGSLTWKYNTTRGNIGEQYAFQKNPSIRAESMNRSEAKLVAAATFDGYAFAFEATPCRIKFNDTNTWHAMRWNGQSYEYNRTFSAGGSYTYEISCYGNTEGYEETNASDSVIIDSKCGTRGKLNLDEKLYCTNRNMSVSAINILSGGNLILDNVTLVVKGETKVHSGGKFTAKNGGNTLWFNKNVTINGTTIWNHERVRLNGTADRNGSVGIILNGNLSVINRTNITQGEDNSYRYFILSNPWSKLRVKDSTLSGLGWKSHPRNNDATYKTSEPGISEGLIINSNESVIENVSIENSTNGISIKNSYGHNLTGINIMLNGSNNGTAILVFNSSNVTILASSIITDGNRSNGIVFIYGNRINVEECDIKTYGNYSRGIGGQNHTKNVLIRNNRINTTDATGEESIAIAGAQPVNWTLRNNTVEANNDHGHGIYMGGGTGLLIEDNKVWTNGQAGTGIAIKVTSKSIVRNNIINTTGVYGLGIAIGHLFGGENRIYNNIIATHNTYSPGIYMDYAGSNLVYNNHLRTLGGTDSDCIDLRNSLNNNLTGNKVSCQASSSSAYYFRNTTGTLVYDSSIANTDYTSYAIQYWNGYSNNTFLNVSFDKSSIGYTSGGTGQVWVQWYVKVYVNDTNGNDANGIIVNITDVSGNLRDNGTTASNGYTKRFNITEFLDTDTGRTNYNNYTFLAYNSTHRGEVSVNISSNKIVNVTVNELTQTECSTASDCGSGFECISNYCFSLQGRFVIQNSSGSNISIVDKYGQMAIAGALTQSCASDPGSNDFIIGTGTNTVAWIDGTSGDMCIDGTLYENAGGMIPDGNDFAVMNASEYVMLVNGSNGNLRLGKKLVQNANIP